MKKSIERLSFALVAGALTFAATGCDITATPTPTPTTEPSEHV